MFWVWTNIKAGYGFSELETYNNDTSLLNSDKFSKESINSFIFNMDTNLYFYPSKKHLKWLSFLGKIGFEYKSNDDNYNALKTVHIRDVQNITDNDGNTIEVKSDVKKVKEGEIVTSNSANINWNFMTVFIPWDKFYIGLSNFGERTYTKDLASTDIGFAVTIPIGKKESGSTKESVPATFTLKYEIPDVENNFSTLDLKEKAVLGFTIGLPLNIL